MRMMHKNIIVIELICGRSAVLTARVGRPGEEDLRLMRGET
jgi:hypothetical protein